VNSPLYDVGGIGKLTDGRHKTVLEKTPCYVYVYKVRCCTHLLPVIGHRLEFPLFLTCMAQYLCADSILFMHPENLEVAVGISWLSWRVVCFCISNSG